ncbi:MAG: teichoic acid transporter [Acidobacteria bacterium]|nr:teichoic acid transporter [Acidobacteriota bacterium]
MIAIISGTIVLICLPVIPLVPWNKVFNLNSNLAASEITASILILLIFCALRLPASVISAVYQAYQEGYIYQIFNGLSGLLSAGCLVAAINLRLGLQWLVLAFLIGMIAGDLFSAVWLFGKWRYWLRPEIKLFDLKQSKWLLKRGSQFWIAQIAAVAMLQTDLIIVSRLFGSSEVAVYGTTLRIFLITGAVQTAFVAPLWAAYGEASARRDIVWLEKAYKRSILISILWSLVFSGLLFLAMPLLFSFLVTPDIKPDSHLTLAMMVTEVVNSAARCISTFLNGLGEIRLQALLGPAGGALNIVLSLVLAKQIGPPGVAWATAICLTLFWLIIMGSKSVLQLRQLRLNSHGA